MINFYLARFDTHMRDVLKGAYIAFIIKVFAVTATFGMNLFIARVLGAEGSGIFFLALTIITIISVLSRLGMENAIVRFISENVAVKKNEKVIGIYNKVIKYVSVASLIISAILYLYSPWISVEIFGKTSLDKPLQIFSLSIFPLALLTINAHALQGLRWIGSYVSVISLGVPLLTLILSVFFINADGVYTFIYSFLLATMFTLFLSFLLWWFASKPFRYHGSEFQNRELFNLSFPMYTANILNITITWAPLLMLGVWESSENIGIYNAATKTAMLIGFIILSVNSIIAPKFAALYKNNEMKNLEKVARGSTKIMVFLAFPFLILFIFFSDSVMLLFGEEFVSGSSVLLVLAVGQFINVATGSVGYLLQMTGYERAVRNTLFISFFLMFSFSIFIIPLYGILGAASVSATILATQNIIMMILAHKYLKIIIFPWFNIVAKT